MDFYQICTREPKGKGKTEVYPDFIVGRSKDLMVRGGKFYAIWDEERQIWSTDEYDVQRLVDADLIQWAEKEGGSYNIKTLRSFGTNGWAQFRKFVQNVSDNSHQLDATLTFADTPAKKRDYVSRRLPYSLEAGECPAWEELISTLYSPEEREKIEWAIGAVISGDAKKIQKFLVFYGPPGSGKGTIINIIEMLFEGYTITFDAKALGSNNGRFSVEVFRSNPLVAIQHDGDLSRIEDNTKLNSIISHETMTVEEKFKATYTSRINAFLFMGTNKPVKITDAQSGIIRRLIDVHPSGATIPANRYHVLMERVGFELGAIAHHCLEVYRDLGKNYYNGYRPVEMMLQTDVFFNFVEYSFDVFKSQDGITLRQAYALYKEFCSETGVDRILPQYKVREELRNYFEEFHDRFTIDGQTHRSYYSGFKTGKFKTVVKKDDEVAYSLVLDETTSLLDEVLASYPAQYAKQDGTPTKYWDGEPRLIDGELKSPAPDQIVSTTLSDLDTSREHYVKVPTNHIVIDFDLRDDSGGKSLDRNLAAASDWPATYGELSKSGQGVHLHYLWTGGDVSELSRDYGEGIEVKVYGGNAALRRRLTRCNRVPIAELKSGLPLKEKKVLTATAIRSEQALRELIARNMRKEIHPGTKPSVDFIHHILEEAYSSGMQYDVSDLRPKLIGFANKSTNQSLKCLQVVQRMHFRSEETASSPHAVAKDERIVFFDIEVYPNLLVVCWKYRGDANVVRMINPSPAEVEGLFGFKLVGYNNRRYDNHILYARFMGYDNQRVYELSKKIVDGIQSAMFGEAYNLSYADVYDFSSKKPSLKRFEIELGLHHMELDLPWDQPVPEDKWGEVVEYCCNDVIATEAVFESREADFTARQILSELSGLTVNDTTQKHTARIIFGDDRNPQKQFVYTDLSKEFPGYVYSMGSSVYRGESPGEGGYVYAEPGIYRNVALLDVASMHPTSIEQLNLFGPYTKNFSELKDARLAIKHKDYETARNLLGGKLAKFVDGDAGNADALSYALKIVINIVYGLTSAKFDNPFRDIRNKDNIVAKRGALFMIDLKHALQEMGVQVVHIKTDSVKIPNATPEIIDMVMRFGEKYGYTFEHEATYDKFCLVNDAVYIARDGDHWTAVGAQFQHPYVFKKLFSRDPVTFADLCETKQVTQGAMYLDFKAEETPLPLGSPDMLHVGRTGLFVPVRSGGGILYRVKEDRYYAVTGTKGYRWLEAEVAKELGDALEVDMSYFERLAEEAIKTIEKFGSFDEFIKE